MPSVTYRSVTITILCCLQFCTSISRYATGEPQGRRCTPVNPGPAPQQSPKQISSSQGWLQVNPNNIAWDSLQRETTLRLKLRLHKIKNKSRQHHVRNVADNQSKNCLNKRTALSVPTKSQKGTNARTLAVVCPPTRRPRICPITSACRFRLR